MREVKYNGKIIARLINSDDVQQGLNFYSDDQDFIQVGVWNYEKGKDLLAHIHNEVERTINRTYEALYIVSGSLEAKIYSLNEELVDTFHVNTGDILVLMECGHGYKILEDNTRVIEIKNGPYLGAEIDRRRI